MTLRDFVHKHNMCRHRKTNSDIEKLVVIEGPVKEDEAHVYIRRCPDCRDIYTEVYYPYSIEMEGKEVEK